MVSWHYTDTCYLVYLLTYFTANFSLCLTGRLLHRACLDQLLIAIRLFTTLCDHSRSKTRLVAIMNLRAKLGIIYTAACHASLCTAALVCLSVSCHYCHTALIQTRYRVRRRVSCSSSWALGLCKVLCWLPRTASRNTPFLPSSASPTGWLTDRPMATVHPHWCHIASTEAYCATLGGSFDRDHRSQSAGYDITIINHFVEWSRQALLLWSCSNLDRVSQRQNFWICTACFYRLHAPFTLSNQ